MDVGTISDRLAARILTVWPMLLGVLAAQLLLWAAPVVAWLRDVLGMEVTAVQVTAVLGLVLGWAVYEAGRWLEDRSGTGWSAVVARVVGRWVLALGLQTGQPSYGKPFTTQSEAVYAPGGELASIRSMTTYAGGASPPAPPGVKR